MFFLKNVIPLCYNKILGHPLILFWVKGKHSISITQHTQHDLKCIKYHFCIDIQKEK